MKRTLTVWSGEIESWANTTQISFNDLQQSIPSLTVSVSTIWTAHLEFKCLHFQHRPQFKARKKRASGHGRFHDNGPYVDRKNTSSTVAYMTTDHTLTIERTASTVVVALRLHVDTSTRFVAPRLRDSPPTRFVWSAVDRLTRSSHE